MNNQLVPTVGTCGVMGTASTMAILTEALGLMIPSGACAPAVSSERRRIAEKTGIESVRIANLKHIPKKYVTLKNFENALVTLSAIGGSTNGLVHLTAIAGRLGYKIDLKRFDELTKNIPMIVDLKPSGIGFMEDLYNAGGVPRILYEIKDYLNLDAVDVTGKKLGDLLKGNDKWQQNVIKTKHNPIFEKGSIAVLYGNLAPRSAIIKQSAASKDLLYHEGKAVVFNGLADLANRIDSEDLNVDKDSVLVLQNIGPRTAPGMPEAGLIPIPKKLAKLGIKDMVRISDGRMSGTASGTIVLHVCPETDENEVFSVIQDGDLIRLDVVNRSLDLLVDNNEINKRLSKKPKKQVIHKRGYNKLFMEHVTQADSGVDFDFLT